MILKLITNRRKLVLLSILFFCIFQTQPLRASRSPNIKVLISKDKKIRIRSDRSIPLIIKGQKFSNKKIKGLTLKKETKRTKIFFDKNKQKINILIKQKLWVVFMIFNITLFEKQIHNLPKFD